jgi:hypothetical protein
MLDDSSQFKPLVGLAASADGGLMIWPAKVPGQSWEFTKVDLPSGRYRGQSARPAKRYVVRSEQPPKIHYHRSGWVTASLTGRDERRGFRGLSIDRLRGEQVFFCLVSHPAGLPSRAAKANDLIGVSHTGWPALVRVEGYVYARSHLRPSLLGQIPGDRAVAVVQNFHAELVVDLAGHGLDAILAVRIKLDDAGKLLPHRVHSVVAAFDTGAINVDGFAETIAVYTPNDTFNPIGLADPALAPFAGPWAASPREPLIRRTRPRVT